MSVIIKRRQLCEGTGCHETPMMRYLDAWLCEGCLTTSVRLRGRERSAQGRTDPMERVA